ncbi:MAG: response regulator [Kofleriaceae bacterium]|nr:response regulator [Myxococcales bacterium]MCB9565275.1 response regulator [Kofleriaceae bacterium]
MQRWRILVCDDDLDVLTELTRGFRAAGHAVVTARDGQAGLAEATSAPPDVVVADVIMPGLNGFQLCRRLKADPTTAGAPVFLISSKVDPADRHWAAQVGAAELIAKPADADALLRRFERALGEQAPARRTAIRTAVQPVVTGDGTEEPPR